MLRTPKIFTSNSLPHTTANHLRDIDVDEANFSSKVDDRLVSKGASRKALIHAISGHVVHDIPYQKTESLAKIRRH
jgi:hypothetical protein